MNAAVFRSLSSGSAIEAAARRTFSTPQAGVPCQGTVGTSAWAKGTCTASVINDRAVLNSADRSLTPIPASCFRVFVRGEAREHLSGISGLHAVSTGQIEMDQPCPSAACIPGHCKLFVLAMKPVPLFQVYLFSVTWRQFTDPCH